MSLPSSAETTLNTVGNGAVREQQDGEERMLPQEIDENWIPSSKNHDDNQIPPKHQGTQDDGEDQNPSSKNKEEDKIPTNIKKTNSKWRPSQEPFGEFCPFEDSDQRTMSNECIYKVDNTIWLISSRMRFVNSVFDTATGPSLLFANMF